jgi:hypothetical protein
MVMASVGYKNMPSFLSAPIFFYPTFPSPFLFLFFYLMVVSFMGLCFVIFPWFLYSTSLSLFPFLLSPFLHSSGSLVSLLVLYFNSLFYFYLSYVLLFVFVLFFSFLSLVLFIFPFSSLRTEINEP